jgi:hypothetical protein
MKSRIPLRIGIPIILMGLPIALLPLGWAGPNGVIVVWCAIMIHAAGADWLLASRDIRRLGAARSAAQLAIAAPTTIYSFVMTWLIAREGDVAWMASPLALLPGLCVWPFLLVALVRGPLD